MSCSAGFGDKDSEFESGSEHSYDSDYNPADDSASSEDASEHSDDGETTGFNEKKRTKRFPAKNDEFKDFLLEIHGMIRNIIKRQKAERKSIGLRNPSIERLSELLRNVGARWPTSNLFFGENLDSLEPFQCEPF